MYGRVLRLNRVVILQGTNMDLQRKTYQQPLGLRQTVIKLITADTASGMDSSSASTLATSTKSMTAANRIGVAVRPTLLFVTGFALNATPQKQCMQPLLT